MARREPELTPDLILNAYASGIFPMAETRDDPKLFWVDPQARGVFPLDGFHISRSLRRRILSGQFTVTFDLAFGEVVAQCANRDETWISERIGAIYQTLHEQGHAHSVEVWEDQQIVGGIYGVSIASAFFGESMFSTRTDASKVALAHLIDRLVAGGYQLFDTQFLTDHLASLGAVEISRHAYQVRLSRALKQPADFHAQGGVPSPQDIVQRNSQTS